MSERRANRLVHAGLAIAWLGVLLSALGAVYARHEARKLFVELEGLTHERDELNIEWGQLQIEQSTWAQHARIEKVASEDLSLVRPKTTDIFVIERP